MSERANVYVSVCVCVCGIVVFQCTKTGAGSAIPLTTL